jgi:hypothetical protein
MVYSDFINTSYKDRRQLCQKICIWLLENKLIISFSCVRIRDNEVQMLLYDEDNSNVYDFIRKEEANLNAIGIYVSISKSNFSLQSIEKKQL